ATASSPRRKSSGVANKRVYSPTAGFTALRHLKPAQPPPILTGRGEERDIRIGSEPHIMCGPEVAFEGVDFVLLLPWVKARFPGRLMPSPRRSSGSLRARSPRCGRFNLIRRCSGHWPISWQELKYESRLPYLRSVHSNGETQRPILTCD